MKRLALLVSCALACATAGTDGPRFPVPGDYDAAIDADGRERTFWLHLPPAHDGHTLLPLLIALHGGGGTAEGFKAYAGLDAVADREGFAVVYPDGTGPSSLAAVGLSRRLLTWNAGGCCGRAARDGVDDVGFLMALLRELARELPVDATRVYATGHSNGAMMAYRLAAERAEHVAAIAPVAAAMSLEDFAPKRAVPVLHIHSVDDPRALYAGGLGPPFPFTRSRVQHRSVEHELARWIEHNGCAPSPRLEASRRPDHSTHTATLLVYEECRDTAEVRLWRLTGAGHGWPGTRSQLPERLVGAPTDVVHAAEEVWSFVARFTRPDAPPLK